MNDTLLLIIASAVTGIVTWLSARRKNELDNTSKAIKIWRELSEDMEKRFKEQIDELKKENCELQKLVSMVKKENEELKSQMNALEVENRKLISQLKIFNKNNQS
jgi:predicted RNase H-like nuclease (RuvC/YqgF family)